MASPVDASDAEEDAVLSERYLTRDGKIRLVLLTKSSRLVSWTAEYVKTGRALEPIIQKAFLKTFLQLISMGAIVKEKTLSRNQ
jgi:hypothetical protein